MKVNLIISRYGNEITGGAERHCKDIAGILPEEWEIHIHTTTAKDYKTWKNEYTPGTTQEGNIILHRYKVDETRNLQTFNHFSEKLKKLYPHHSLRHEWNWLKKQGPFSSSFFRFLKEEVNNSDINIYFSYLYYPTVYGLMNSRIPSVLVPMLHDEFPAYLKLYKSIFTQNRFYVFNAPEEQDLFFRIYGFHPEHSALIGTYVDFPPEQLLQSDQKPEKLYILMIGRLDMGKGILDLINDFVEWKSISQNNLELWIAGKDTETMEKKIRKPFLKFLGYISEEEKAYYIREAAAIINPSSLESFSILLMESWAQGRPVIVNANSPVTKGHCVRSNGGLFYKDKESLFSILNLLVRERSLFERMGRNGREYVRKNFLKEIVKNKWLSFLERVTDH